MVSALKAESLTRKFGDLTAVRDVSFHVDSGEVVGLLGPNGAGKTTILRMLAGILTPTTGRVTVHGDDIHLNPIHAKPKLGFLSGDTHLYQRLTPREVLVYFGRLYGMEEAALRARIEELVRELDMSSFANRSCSTLSSGQKQRANIARAFLHAPSILILDEPTTALDIISGQFIIQAIKRQKAAGRAILFSTHIMSEAEYLCDRILLLHQGSLVGEGTLPELLRLAGKSNLTDTFLSLVGQEEAA